MASKKVELNVKNFNPEWVKSLKKKEDFIKEAGAYDKIELEKIYDQIVGTKKES